MIEGRRKEEEKKNEVVTRMILPRVALLPMVATLVVGGVELEVVAVIDIPRRSIVAQVVASMRISEGRNTAVESKKLIGGITVVK